MNNNSTLFEINRGIQEINTTADTALLQDHQEAMKAFDTEELVSLCSKLSALVVGLWVITKTNLMEGKLDDKIDEMDLVLTKVFDSVPRVLEYATNAGATLKSKGFDISGLSALNQAKANVIDVKSEFERNWPRVDKAMIHESKEANKKRR